MYDANWCVRYVNQAAALAMGAAKAVSPESLVGKNLWTLYPDLPGTGFEREMRRCQTDRVPVTFELSASGIVETIGRRRTRTSWSLIQRCEIRGSGVVLHLGEGALLSGSRGHYIR